MRICQVEIENFRGVKRGKVVFPDHSVLFGPNNCGQVHHHRSAGASLRARPPSSPTQRLGFPRGLAETRITFPYIGTITDFAAPPQDEPENFPKWFLGDAARPVWWRPDAQVVSVEVDRPEGPNSRAKLLSLCATTRVVRVSNRFDISTMDHAIRSQTTSLKLPSAILRSLACFYYRATVSGTSS